MRKAFLKKKKISPFLKARPATTRAEGSIPKDRKMTFFVTPTTDEKNGKGPQRKRRMSRMLEYTRMHKRIIKNTGWDIYVPSGLFFKILFVPLFEQNSLPYTHTRIF